MPYAFLKRHISGLHYDKTLDTPSVLAMELPRSYTEPCIYEHAWNFMDQHYQHVQETKDETNRDAELKLVKDIWNNNAT